MGLFDTVTVDVLAAAFQTKQLGEDMLHYRLTGEGQLVAPCGGVVPYHGLVHLYGEEGVTDHPKFPPCDQLIFPPSCDLGREQGWTARAK